MVVYHSAGSSDFLLRVVSFIYMYVQVIVEICPGLQTIKCELISRNAPKYPLTLGLNCSITCDKDLRNADNKAPEVAS